MRGRRVHGLVGCTHVVIELPKIVLTDLARVDDMAAAEEVMGLLVAGDRVVQQAEQQRIAQQLRGGLLHCGVGLVVLGDRVELVARHYLAVAVERVLMTVDGVQRLLLVRRQVHLGTGFLQEVRLGHRAGISCKLLPLVGVIAKILGSRHHLGRALAGPAVAIDDLGECVLAQIVGQIVGIAIQLAQGIAFGHDRRFGFVGAIGCDVVLRVILGLLVVVFGNLLVVIRKICEVLPVDPAATLTVLLRADGKNRRGSFCNPINASFKSGCVDGSLIFASS